MSQYSGRARLLALLSCLALGLTGCAGGETEDHRGTPEELALEDASYPEGYEAVATAGGMTLLADRAAGSVAVEAGGHTWYASPLHPEEDPVASGPVQDRMRSQFMLYYYDANSELKTMDSYTDSVSKGQYRVEELDGGVEMVFTLGSFERGAGDIPKVLSNQRFRELFTENPALEEGDKSWVEKRYRQEDGDWVWRETDANLIIQRLLEILDTIGYDDQQLQQDNAAAGVEAAASDRVVFQVTVRYLLDEDGLHVEVPMDRFRYAGDVEPVRLDLLEFFGAAEDTEDGYIFVPDGSGALMNLEPAPASGGTYEGRVYGGEEALAAGEQPVRLPVYGLKNGGAAFLAIIEEGDALATVHAYKSGLTCNRSGVYSSFILKESGYVTLGNREEETEVLSFQNRLYQGNIRVLYRFLSGESADYAGMAAAYRDWLIQRRTLTQRVKTDRFPLTVQTIGGVKKAQSFLMIRYEGWEALTTYEQAGEIADWLLDQGASGVRLQLTAWLTGGFEQVKADSASPLSGLGGKSGLKKLVEKYESSAVLVEGLVHFGQYVSSNPFTLYGSAARTVDQAMAENRPLDLVTQKPIERTAATILSAGRLPDLAKKYCGSGRLQGIDTAVADLGNRLYGDYNRSGTVDRETAKNKVREALEILAGEEGLSLNGGNAYALDYASFLGEIPLRSSGYMVLDGDVPFYAMALHGYVEMAASPLNYEDNGELAVLEAIAAGVGGSCRWMAADSSLLKDTDYAEYYSAGYADSRDWVLAAYQRVKEAVGDLQGLVIADHDAPQAGVTVTTYENGVKIYVNRTGDDLTLDGVQVPAMGYARTE